MNEFETVANEIDKRNQTYESSQECAIEWIRNSRTATATFPGNTKYCSKVKKLAEEYPEEVKIKYTNPDGSIVATLPTKYIKISAPKKVSEEQREKMRQRIKEYGFKKRTDITSDDEEDISED